MKQRNVKQQRLVSLFMGFLLLQLSTGVWAFDLLYSQSANRGAPLELNGSIVSGIIYVFVAPPSGITQVAFQLDGKAISTDKKAPYDLKGTKSNGIAKPYSTAALTEGPHVIKATITRAGGGRETAMAVFDVNHHPDYLSLQASELEVGSGAANPLILTFNLPASLLRSGKPTLSAVVEFSARGVALEDKNEMYINPPGNICRPDNADANQPASIGYVNGHNATTNSTDEYYVNSRAFPSTKLKVGTNRLMFCARDKSGDLTGVIDNFSVHSIVLYFQHN